jgi:hypothetical protein
MTLKGEGEGAAFVRFVRFVEKNGGVTPPRPFKEGTILRGRGRPSRRVRRIYGPTAAKLFSNAMGMIVPKSSHRTP